jgi:hypothetical protein
MADIHQFVAKCVRNHRSDFVGLIHCNYTAQSLRHILIAVTRKRQAASSDRPGFPGPFVDLFGSPVRVNDATDTVESIALDGMRAAIAVTSDNTIALAWSDNRAQIRAATSTNGGISFEPSIRLDQAEEPAYRGFPSISFDQSGDLHATWIDSRFAEDFAEEPADLYYAKVSNGAVQEKNLTANQQTSICGCCRTFINAEAGSLKIAFRNTTAEGFRDPYAITTSKDVEFSAPQAVTSPLWELAGCPMAGADIRGQRSALARRFDR